MKKIFIFILLLILTGCTVVRIDTTNIDTIIDVVLTKENKLFNRVGKGYKYYVPKGVMYVDTNELNEVLYSNGNYYYLYIDLVNYYYKSKLKYKENNAAYYSRKFDKKDGFKYSGYLEITKAKDNMYHIDFMYNYSKVEALVEKEDLNESVLNISYILSTIKYNKTVIDMMMDEDYFTNKTGKYNNYKTNDSSNKFKLKTQKEKKES